MKQAKKEEFIINKSQLSDFFHSGSKPESEFKIGLEFEKPGINMLDFKAVPYFGENGILEFLKKYRNFENSSFITEDEHILGLKNSLGSITLEPGSQFEIGLLPQKNIHEIFDRLTRYNRITAELAEEFNIYWLGYGIQPLSTYQNIDLIPKKRYGIMAEYLPLVGDKSPVMMRETAGIQVSVDYKSPEDAINKLKVSLGISPIITAMFANSPIRNGMDTGYKTFRASSWLSTDNARCGLISEKIFESGSYDFNFNDYVNILLDLPMMFLKKEGKWINMRGLPFRNYLDSGYQCYRATVDDWLLHINSFFPDVRLNNYLEIRNCDCQRSDLIFANPALWKGIIYNSEALDAAWALVKDFTWEERAELRNSVPKYALDTLVRGKKVSDLAKELVNIADCSLKLMAEANLKNQDESVYLDNLKELLSESKTPADKILELWHAGWNKDLSKLAEYTRLT